MFLLLDQWVKPVLPIILKNMNLKKINLFNKERDV